MSLRDALYEGRALRQQAKAVRAAVVARAAQDVLDRTCESADEAARGRGLSGSVVQAAVRKARAAMSDPTGTVKP